MTFVKGMKVVYRVTSGFCTLQWEGVVTVVRKNKCYVLFDGGGGWYEKQYLTDSTGVLEACKRA